MRSDQFEAWALPVLAAWPKVLDVVNGRIPVPEVVEIFPTNYCNFYCGHCRFKQHHGTNAALMPIPVLDKLLAELSEHNVENIELSGGGEPLIHPRIHDLFRLLIERRFRVGLITNGSSFIGDGDLQELAAQCCTWIRFSVDAFSEEVYRRVHGSPDLSFDKLRRAIQELRRRRAPAPRIGVKMLISRLNVEDAERAIAEAANIGSDYVQLKFLAMPPALALGVDDIERVSRAIQGQIRSHGGGALSVELLPPYKGSPPSGKCLMTFLHPVIDWDGEVYVCAFFEHRKDRHSMGNIRDGGFCRVWGGGRHRLVFDAVDSGECVPNCPMSRYNPLIDFIVSEDYRKGFI